MGDKSEACSTEVRAGVESLRGVYAEYCGSVSRSVEEMHGSGGWLIDIVDISEAVVPKCAEVEGIEEGRASKVALQVVLCSASDGKSKERNEAERMHLNGALQAETADGRLQSVMDYGLAAKLGCL